MKPNICVIFADQLRASSVGYTGEEPVITPHLDELARHAAIFATAVSPAPVCTPYRGSLITGRTSLSLGLVLNDIPLSRNEPKNRSWPYVQCINCGRFCRASQLNPVT